MKTTTTTLMFLFVLFALIVSGQVKTAESAEFASEYIVDKNDANHPCITPQQYQYIQEQSAKNCKLLGLENVGQKPSMVTPFAWPLKPSNNLKDCGYYSIYNYVDQNPAATLIKDWNCGSSTYDGHRGTDIAIYPYPYYKMDSDQVQVIAAASGTIIMKDDGYFDKWCVLNNSNLPNFIGIKHADGSGSYYLHMKKNSLTSKIVGQTVVAGEFLGIVGSSGYAQWPHLHFEVWSTSTFSNTMIDPFSGTCNTLNASSWWAIQKPYTEPAVVRAQVNKIPAVFPACPNTETPNEDSCYTPGALAKFYSFYRNETVGMIANMRIVQSGGSTFSAWTATSAIASKNSYKVSNQTLPVTAGGYTFEVIYNGTTCSKTFTVNCLNVGINEIKNNSEFHISPNPTNNLINISIENATEGSYNFIFKNVVGQNLIEEKYKTESGSFQKTISISELPNGIYFLTIENNTSRIIKKIIKQN